MSGASMRWSLMETSCTSGWSTGQPYDRAVTAAVGGGLGTTAAAEPRTGGESDVGPHLLGSVEAGLHPLIGQGRHDRQALPPTSPSEAATAVPHVGAVRSWTRTRMWVRWMSTDRLIWLWAAVTALAKSSVTTSMASSSTSWTGSPPAATPVRVSPSDVAPDPHRLGSTAVEATACVAAHKAQIPQDGPVDAIGGAGPAGRPRRRRGGGGRRRRPPVLRPATTLPVPCRR